MDGDQREMTSIESRPGPYNGERVHSVFDGDVGGLVPGPYTLDVEATGPWRMRLFQERAVSGQRTEITWWAAAMAAAVGCNLEKVSTL